MGATLGNHKFTSQTNHNADSVPPDVRFKWIDDLTVLEKINLLGIGMASYNFKQHITSDIPITGQRVSQEFFQTTATPKFSAFGYLKMEFIEKKKNKFIKFFGIFFWLFLNWKPH